MKHFTRILFLLIFFTQTVATAAIVPSGPTKMDQGFRSKGSASIGKSTAPDASALLDMSSTSKGVLPPRMTTAQRDAIASPANGLQIHNTTTNKPNYWNGTSWLEVGSGSSSGDGGINYIANGNAELTDISNFTTYDDSWANDGNVVNTATDTWTYAVNVYGSIWDGLPVRVNGPSTAPGGITYQTQVYYVRDYNGGFPNATFKLATTPGGTAVDITSIGGGSGFDIRFSPITPRYGVIFSGASGVTWTRETSPNYTPLFGTASHLFTKGAGFQAGKGVIVNFPIDDGAKGKRQTLTLDYAFPVGAANYNDNDIYFAIVDLLNGKTIQTCGLPKHLVTQGLPFKCTFDATDSKNYRLIQHYGGSSTVAFGVLYDSIKISPQAPNPTGAIVTDWVSFTPTGTWTTNTAYSGRYRRVGDSAEVEIGLSMSGAPNATSLFLNMPAGLSIDTSKYALTSRPPVGYGTGETSVGYAFSVNALGSSTTQVEPVYANSVGQVGGVTATAPATWASGNKLNFFFQVPVVGWTSGLTLSSDTSGRNIAFSGTAAASQAVNGSTDWTVTAEKDTTGSWTGSSFVSKEAGDFLVIASALTSAQSTHYLFVDGVQQSGFLTSTQAGASNAVQGSIIAYDIKPGNAISIRTQNAVTLTSKKIQIIRLNSGSQTIGLLPKQRAFVAINTAMALDTAGQLVTSTNTTQNDGNMYAAGWVTCPSKGTLHLRLSVRYGNALKGGTQQAWLASPAVNKIRKVGGIRISGSTVDFLEYTGGGSQPCNGGESYGLRLYAEQGGTLDTDPLNNWAEWLFEPSGL